MLPVLYGGLIENHVIAFITVSWNQHLAANVDVTNMHSIFHTLGIPVSGGLALGFIAGFVRAR